MSRSFTARQHLVDVLAHGDQWQQLHDEAGHSLDRIRGREGARGLTAEGLELGVDLIEMEASTAFPTHIHPGDHILYGLEGEGEVRINGLDYPLRQGTTVFIAADQPHAVRGPSSGTLRFLAFGIPHHHLSSTNRMRVVDESEEVVGTG